MITCDGTMQQRSCLRVRREKIIVHPAQGFVQSPLVHLKWGTQCPPRNCFFVVFSVLCGSQTCTRVGHYVRPTFFCHVLQPGHSAQAVKIVQDESPARTHRSWCVCDSARQGASQMLTFLVGAHPEVFETIRWWPSVLLQEFARLIEDGSNTCWASGPAGMIDGVMTLEKATESCICVERHWLKDVSRNTVRRQHVEICAKSLRKSGGCVLVYGILHTAYCIRRNA